MLKSLLSLTLCLVFCASPVFSASIEYTNHYLKRKHMVQKKADTGKKYTATHTRSGTRIVGHTDTFVPACNLYFGVGAKEEKGRFNILVQEAGKVVAKDVAGVIPKGDKGEAFLQEMVAGNYIKICHPKFESMPSDREYGLIYVEPVLESLQELLLDKKMAVLFNASEEK